MNREEKINFTSMFKVPEEDRMKLFKLTFYILLIYSSASFVIGYIYVPGKNGGFHLSGISTLAAISSILIFCYELREKIKRKKQKGKVSLFKIAACLFIIAFLLNFTPFASQSNHIYNGFVENLTIPKWTFLQNIITVNSIENLKISIAILIFASMFISYFAKESGSKKGPYISMLFLVLFVFFVVLFFLAQSIGSIIFGSSVMDYGHNVIFHLAKEPGKFLSVIILQILFIPFGATCCFFLAKALSTTREKSQKEF